MNRSDPALHRPIVLFDGGCPLCRREIDHYRRLRGASAIDWIDLHSAAALLSTEGLRLDDVMKRMHVRDTDGSWVTGASAFVALWSNLPAYRWLGRLGGLPVIRQLAELLYRLFAARRYRARCRDGYCPTTSP